MKIEQILGLVADSQRFGAFNDPLSEQTRAVNEKYFSSSMTLLSDSEMQMVAGGQPDYSTEPVNPTEPNGFL